MFNMWSKQRISMEGCFPQPDIPIKFMGIDTSRRSLFGFWTPIVMMINNRERAVERDHIHYMLQGFYRNPQTKIELQKAYDAYYRMMDEEEKKNESKGT